MTTAIRTPTNLSNADEKTLNAVFDPENSPDTPTVKIDTSLPSDPKIKDDALLKQIRSRELQAIRLVEQFSIEESSKPSLSFNSRSEGGSNSSTKSKKYEVYQNSLSILSNLIKDHPYYASAYNNRAQLHRWRFGDQLLDISTNDSQTAAALDAIVEDLDTAISIATPSGTNAAVSPTQAKLLSQAWTQRGAVLWGISKRRSSAAAQRQSVTDTMTSKGEEPEWRTWDSVHLEEEGSRSFFMAGMFGSEIGRTMAVKTNPYARLCAGIVKEAMRSEYGV